MYCSSCGNEVDPNSNFCSNCSAEIIHAKENGHEDHRLNLEKTAHSNAVVYFLGASSVLLSLSIFFPWLSFGNHLEYSPLGLISALEEIDNLSYLIAGSSRISDLDNLYITILILSIATTITNAINAYLCFAKKSGTILGYVVAIVFSAGSIIAVFSINSGISSYTSSYLGSVVASYASSVLSVTMWPWILALLSLVSIVMAFNNRSSCIEEQESIPIKDILVCGECHSEILPEHKFCPTCSAPIPQNPIRYIDTLSDSQSDEICPACGAEISAEDTFCKECALRLRD